MKNRKGEIFITNEGFQVQIIEYNSCYDCTIQFKNGFILRNREYGDLKKGHVKYPYFKSVCNIGYHGEGKFSSSKDPKKNKCYRCWKNILLRCYETSSKYDPIYKNCTISKEWENFQNFAAWYHRNYIDNWELDKDFLILNNKVYSSTTCCFLPRELNNIFKSYKKRDLPVGVFKQGRYFFAKLSMGDNVLVKSFRFPQEASLFYQLKRKDYIKTLTNKFKSQLDPIIYKKLIEYSNNN